MPKKRVGVSLRKPSPAPEPIPESAALPTDLVDGEPPLDSAPSTVAMAAGAPSERPSDIVALRGAPAPGETKSIEAFVNGAAAAFEKVAAEIPVARLAEVLERGIEGYRELVLYLPEKLAQELSLHCLKHDLDMNRLVATAIERHLEGTSFAATAGARRGEGAAANDGLLSFAARVLMSELATWVRSVWARRRASAGSVPASAAG